MRSSNSLITILQSSTLATLSKGLPQNLMSKESPLSKIINKMNSRKKKWSFWYNIFLRRYFVFEIHYILVRGSLNKFPDFFVWALLLIVHTWNSSPLRSNLLRLKCTCCTVPTTSGRPHGSPLVWACQWPSSQLLSSPQMSHKDSLWA